MTSSAAPPSLTALMTILPLVPPPDVSISAVSLTPGSVDFASSAWTLAKASFAVSVAAKVISSPICVPPTLMVNFLPFKTPAAVISVNSKDFVSALYLSPIETPYCPVTATPDVVGAGVDVVGVPAPIMASTSPLRVIAPTVEVSSTFPPPVFAAFTPVPAS